MAISDIKFGKWYSIIELEEIIEKHISIEDIHCEQHNREANEDAKKFYNEILPIFHYAKDCNASDVYYVDDTMPENNFDGKIKVDNTIIDIECTKAISQEDAVEQCRIDDICHKEGLCQLPSISMPLDEFRNEVANCIKTAIEKKIEKAQKQMGKYNGFHLILTLDDTLFNFCTKYDIIRGIQTYFTLSDINPFAKIVLYWKTSTGYPKKIKELY